MRGGLAKIWGLVAVDAKNEIGRRTTLKRPVNKRSLLFFLGSRRFAHIILLSRKAVFVSVRCARAEAHAKIERPSGSRKPVSLFVCAWALVLRIKIERPVRVVLEWHPATGGETVQAARNLKAFLVVDRRR
jgi:hypothetical protein